MSRKESGKKSKKNNKGGEEETGREVSARTEQKRWRLAPPKRTCFL